MDAVTAVLLMESSMGKLFGEISVLKSCFQPDLDRLAIGLGIGFGFGFGFGLGLGLGLG